ncbi:hypothetical protein [Buttiauxella gaviniae]|uniref:hypothetical protein n=1 Tax=Buttiauxella gaviniae TaxID=82990 RepID=UPI003BB4DB34
MELIENYQPEYVKSFKENNNKCLCQACKKEGNGFPFVTLRWKNQQRESLSLSCQAAAKEILLNPKAFILHTTVVEVVNNFNDQISNEVEMLNQIFINNVIDESLSYRESLYSMSLLLNKIQRRDNLNHFDVQELISTSEELAGLISAGEFKKHFKDLPDIPEFRQRLLVAMGNIRLDIDLPSVQKMSFMLKLSELNILSRERITERLIELEEVAKNNIDLFDNVDYIFKNIVIYKIYHHNFPDLGQQSITAFQHLCEELFEIKMLLLIYLSDNTELDFDVLSRFISSYYRWSEQSAKPVPINDEDELLYGLAVL